MRKMEFLLRLDSILFAWLNGFAGRSLQLDRFFAYSAEYVIFAIVAGVLFFLLKKTAREKILVLTAFCGAVVGRFVFVLLLRLLEFRARPFVNGGVHQLLPHDPAEASFPSGHTTVMFAIAFAVFAYDRGWGTIFLLVSLWSAVARIVSGVHFPLDIAGGIFVGLISFLISRKLTQHFYRRFFVPAEISATMQKP